MLIKTLCYSDSCIAFTVGVDDTVVVKSWQLLENYGSIVCGSYRNNVLDINKISDDESVNLIKECIEGNDGEKSEEVKVTVITLKVAPKGFIPYFTLIRRAQTIN